MEDQSHLFLIKEFTQNLSFLKRKEVQGRKLNDFATSESSETGIKTKK